MQNNEDHPDPQLYGENMLAVVASANDLCSYAERLGEEEPKAFIGNILLHLSEVYRNMLRMPLLEPRLNDPVEQHVSESDWSALYQEIARLLGPYNEYLRPVEEEDFDRSDLVPHTISEDLADLYQELRDFTVNFSRGLEETMNDAAWELRERFLDQWGKKLLSAQGALHGLYSKGVDPEKE